MDYIIDKHMNSEISNIIEVHSQFKENGVNIVDGWKVVYGEKPFSKDGKLYRNFRSLKSDKQWVEAVFRYWFDA